MTCPLLSTSRERVCASCGARAPLSSHPRCPNRLTVVERIDGWAQGERAASVGEVILIGLVMASLVLLVGYGVIGPYWLDLLGDGL